MAGYQKFEVDKRKYSRGFMDVWKLRKNQSLVVENMSKDQRWREKVKLWASFYRANPHRFVEDYFGIKLHLFQKILIYMAFHRDFFMYIAARGQSKTFITALICCVRCVLYPGTNVILASGTKGQAALIITEKVEKVLIPMSPSLHREIRDIVHSQHRCCVTFRNGSTIEAVTSTSYSRGYRGNVLVLEEFRLIDFEMLNKVLRMFLTVNRQPPYLMKPEYSHLTEENIEIYISSAWYKSHWIWEKFKSFTELMCKGKDYFVCAIPYHLSLYHGLLSQKRVEQMREEADFDEISWLMEMETMFFGESEKAYFKLADIQKCRDLLKPFYPYDNMTFLEQKSRKIKDSFKIEKRKNEIRIIGVDVAMMAGRAVDNTIFTCLRMFPNRDEYVRQVVYIESMTGQHSETQAIRLKQLFNDFEADYVAMDTLGNGISLYDDCAKVLYDSERDVEYPAWCAFNNEEMRSRALDEYALPVIYSVKVVSQQVNHEMAMFLKTCFEKRKIKLLVDEIKGREYLQEVNKDYIKRSPEEQAKFEIPYIQTSALVNELVNLEYELRNGYVKVKEVGTRKKDRYSSLAYAMYLSKILESDLSKTEESTNAMDYFFFD